MITPPLATIDGSSPLTRGALAVTCRNLIFTSDHPRSRGEHVSRHSDTMVSTGSSPLTRGARRHELDERMTIRIIPAHAGSTKAAEWYPNRETDHPRSRGEH